MVFDEKATRVTGGEVGFGDAYPRGGFTAIGFGAGETRLRLKPVILPGPPPRTVTEPGPADFVAAGVTELWPQHFQLVDASGSPVTGNVDAAFDGVSVEISQMSRVIASVDPDDPLTPGGQFEFDLNHFVQTADRLRIVWRD